MMKAEEPHPSRQKTAITTARRLVRDVFGFDDFLPFQEEIIEGALGGEDLLVVLPTGSGKSLCFQVPALSREGLTIVISPLIALMKDQIDALRAHNLPVRCLHSSLPRAEAAQVHADLRAGRLKMIYVSPERLRDSFFLNSLIASAQPAPLWVVDEAHCITEWGHDFRTDYLFIPDAIELVAGTSQLVMFTATATPIVREDILRQMRRERARTVYGNFDRPNLYLGCRQANSKSDKLRTISELLRRPGPGVIYTATRRQCEDVNRFLQELGRNSDYYHAGRSAEARADVHERFLSNRIDMVVATNAFGMGVDKSDIRFIIHYAHPGSIDAYYQEIGRGGRDGERCDCILLFSRFDRKVQEQFIVNSTPGLDEVEERFAAIQQMKTWHGEVALKRSFYEEHNVELFELEKAGLLKRRPVMGGRASIYLSRSFDRALDMCSPRQRAVLGALESEVGLSSKGYADVDVNEIRMAHFPDTSTFSLEQTLLEMNENGILAYRPAERRICYKVLEKSVGASAGARIEENVSQRRAFKRRRLEMIIEYGALRSCLREYLLSALADRPAGPSCGFCDNCL